MSRRQQPPRVPLVQLVRAPHGKTKRQNRRAAHMERQRAPPKGREAENGSRGIDSRGRIPERLCRCHSRYAKEKNADVGGEKTTAQKKLAKLLKDNGINSLDELQKEEYEYTIFSYNGKHEIKLLRQCMYKVMGAKSDRTAYKPYGRRQKIGIYCTKAQKIEIELEFEFYRNVFYEELSTFMDAFIQAQKIFPEDAPVGDYDEFNERDMKIAFMATGIERRSRAAMIEESEAGNEKTKTTGS